MRQTRSRTRKEPDMKSSYKFDVRLFATIDVEADNPEQARAMVDAAFDCVDANFGAWPDGSPILGEASADSGLTDLMEINGEPVS